MSTRCERDGKQKKRGGKASDDEKPGSQSPSFTAGQDHKIQVSGRGGQNDYPELQDLKSKLQQEVTVMQCGRIAVENDSAHT
ncbi:hypothetical protein DHEL01_v203975 [Diaporthe helianthi]|uniref:Uncharacterized protein n=1 Tax=Diaporthe helianthi TaxID=158607 RepID=A0A2P5I539_DIAHE|nr:hypothetical protein DHEL01_v203975 [Diaporthe helianthi]